MAILTLGILMLDWIFFLGVIFVIGTYIALPSVLAKFRSLRYFEGKYLNEEGEDLSDRLPNAFVLQFAVFMVLSVLGFLNIDPFINWLNLDKIFSEKTVDIIGCVATVSIPWIIMHLYFFIKDLPLISYGSYTTGNSLHSRYNTSSISSPGSDSSFQYNDHRHNPAYSYLGGNIYHKNTRN
jgi:hypothetical protein